MHTLRTALIIAVALTLSGAPAALAQSTTYDFEAGYQWTDITGNKDMYRTQVNQSDGIVLRNLSLNILDPKGEGMFDRLRIDAAGFGGDPTGRFRLEAGRGTLYRLTLNYNHAEYFSALPELANPFLDNGVVPGQHTWNRKRDFADFQLEFLPGRTISPFVGYSWNRFDGSRHTTLHVGQDEFQLRSNLEETEKEFYAGASFSAGGFSGAVTQGWRTYEGRDHQLLAPWGGDGNNPGSVLGQPITADSITSASTTKADTPVTNVYVNGKLGEKVQIKAAFARADADGDATLSETSVGSLASFEISRFFSSLQEDVRSKTESPSWRGDLRASYDFSQFLTFEAGYQKRSMELDGWALVTSIYLDTMTFGGLGTGDITKLAEMRNHTERTQDTVDFKLNFVSLGIFKVWAGGSQTKLTLKLAEDAEEIVVPGSQSGSFDRKITSGFLGASAQIGKGKVILDGRSDSADEAILRTDFTDRSRVRFRVQYPFGRFVELLGTAEKVTSDNEDTDIGYTTDTKHYSVGLGVKPVNHLNFQFNWDSFKSDSRIPIRRPYDFGIEESLYTDDAKLLEGMLELNFDTINFQGGYSSLKNEGSFEFKLKRIFAQASMDFTPHVAGGLEYDKQDYSENLFSAADFKASRYGIFIRVH